MLFKIFIIRAEIFQGTDVQIAVNLRSIRFDFSNLLRAEVCRLQNHHAVVFQFLKGFFILLLYSGIPANSKKYAIVLFGAFSLCTETESKQKENTKQQGGEKADLCFLYFHGFSLLYDSLQEGY